MFNLYSLYFYTWNYIRNLLLYYKPKKSQIIAIKYINIYKKYT